MLPSVHVLVRAAHRPPRRDWRASRPRGELPGYERVPVARLPAGDWRIGSNVVPRSALAFPIEFHEGTRQVGQVEHWSALSEAGYVVFAGTMRPGIWIDSGVTPILSVSIEECQGSGDLIALVSMRGIIADAAGHPCRDAALRAIDRLARSG